MSLWLFLLSVTLLKISFLSFPSLLHIKIHFFLPGSCITHRLGKGTKCKLEESAEGSRKAAWEQHSDTKYRSERSLPLCAVILCFPVQNFGLHQETSEGEAYCPIYQFTVRLPESKTYFMRHLLNSEMLFLLVFFFTTTTIYYIFWVSLGYCFKILSR